MNVAARHIYQTGIVLAEADERNKAASLFWRPYARLEFIQPDF
jgi:hypothetical protein